MTSLVETGRWRGVVALSLFAGAVGLLAQRPAVLLLAALGVGYAVYPRLVSAPSEPDVVVERSLDPASPAPEESVAVTVTVRNEGDRWLPDLRVIDGVPSLLPVVDGTPRLATALGPGDEATLEYAVEARVGKHRFQPTTVLARDASGAGERRTSAHEATVLDCGEPVSSSTLRSLTTRRAGELLSDVGGSGIEFHRVREYRAGDPMRQVDWRRYAKSGELGTVEYTEERSASVLLCVDVGHPDGDGNGRTYAAAEALARSVGAADRLAAGLTAANHEVGLAAHGPQWFWLAPGLGPAHRVRIERALNEHPAFVPTGAGDWPEAPTAEADDEPDAPVAPGDDAVGLDGARADAPGAPAAMADGGQGGESTDGRARRTAALRERLDSTTQVILLSPLADDGVVESVRTLEAAGNLVTVVSPGPASSETTGARLARVERSNRIRRLRRFGIPVVDWESGEHLENAIAATMERSR